jgi:hypothetical protein
MHKVRRTYADLPVGETVSIRDIDFQCRVRRKEAGKLIVEFDWWYDHEFEPRLEIEEVSFARYEYSYLQTQDNMAVNKDEDWSSMEQAYGINHHGSNDPAPARRLAFQILKGNPIACEIATQLLGNQKRRSSRV